MVVIPKQQPVLENLNIYYLDVRKLLEHFQGEIGSGGKKRGYKDILHRYRNNRR